MIQVEPFQYPYLRPTDMPISYIEARAITDRVQDPSTLVLHSTCHFSNELSAAHALSRSDRACDYVVGRGGGLVRLTSPQREAVHVTGAIQAHPGQSGDVSVALCNKGPAGRAVATSKRYARRAPFGWVEARHAKGRRLRYWELYGKPQLDSLVELIPTLIVSFPTLQYVCGHDDISRDAMDPGPVFPWSLIDWGQLGLARVQRDWDSGHWYRWNAKRRRQMEAA